jgi:hypothetical protein
LVRHPGSSRPRRDSKISRPLEAFRSGDLSQAQATEIAASASVDPDAEARLLATARDGGSYRVVRDQCREATMRASDDPARARRLHETRSARTYPGLDGHLALHAELAPAVGAEVHSVLEQKTDELFRAHRSAGTTELRAAYVADALAALILGDGPRPSPDVHMNADADRRAPTQTRRGLSPPRGSDAYEEVKTSGRGSTQRTALVFR